MTSWLETQALGKAPARGLTTRLCLGRLRRLPCGARAARQVRKLGYRLVCDDVRTAGNHIAYFWTFTGTHAHTKNPLRIVGWEKWDLDGDMKVVASRGWYDADEYARQTAPR